MVLTIPESEQTARTHEGGGNARNVCDTDQQDLERYWQYVIDKEDKMERGAHSLMVPLDSSS